MIFQSNDDEEREIKRGREDEDIVMTGSINLQHATKLLRMQQQQHQRQKEKSISPKYDLKPHISPKQKQRSNR
jgi:hypothetical protein